MEASTPDETFDIRSTGTVSGTSLGDASHLSASRRGSVVLQANMAPITREFQFVDVNNSGSRKQARSHVMRQYLREKRKQQSFRLETSLHAGSSSAFTPLQWQKRNLAETSRGFDELQLDLRPKSSDSASGSEDELPTSNAFTSRSDDIMPYNRRLPLPSPQTPMSAARKDPFASLPISLDDEGNQLMDFFVTVVPGLVFRDDVRATYLFNPIRDVLFKEAMVNPLVFQGSVLAFTAGYKARWYGFKETEQSRRHQLTSIRLAEETTRQHSGLPTNGLIMGLTCLAHWEDRWGSRAFSYQHLALAQRMMKERSDMTAPRPRLPCETWLHWLHYTMGPKPETDGSTSPRDPSLASCLQNFHHLMLFHRETLTMFPNLRRIVAFEPGTALHRLVARKTESIPDEPYIFSIIQRMHLMIRLASLLYIHLGLWDYRESLDDMEEYLTILERITKQHGIDRWPSTSLLLWAMLDGEDHPRLGNPGRAWIVGDVLNEAKKLSCVTQESLCDFLLALLERKDPPTSLLSWESELAAS